MRSADAGGLLLSLLPILGCGSTDPDLPPGAPDCHSPACSQRPGGGGSLGGDASSSDGPDTNDGATGDRVAVTFTVRQTVDTWFWNAVPSGGAVTVNAAGLSGQPVGSGDAGVAPSGVLESVEPGPNWFAVEDAISGRRIVPTLQFVTVDAQRPIVDLRAVALDGITTLVVDQVLWTPPPGTATLILNFRRGGRAVAGVIVNGDALPSGASVAYDTSGGYVSDAMILGTIPATGGEGTAIVRQVPGIRTFPGLIPLTLPYRLGTSNLPPIEAKLARDFVTWMAVDIP